MKKYLLVSLMTISAFSCTLLNQIASNESPSGLSVPQAGLIAYIGTDGNVYITSPEGENTQAITKDANPSPSPGELSKRYQQPAWSPDGTRLAFVGTEGTLQAVDQAVVYTVRDDGSELTGAFTSKAYFPFYLYWSPDSQSISFLSNGTTEEGLVLHLADALGSESHIVGTGQPFYWAWSPDSDLLVIHTGGDQATNPQARLAFLSSTAGGVNRAMELSPAVFQAPDWSQDGERVVVATTDETGKSELVLAGRDGSKQQSLVEFEGNIAFSLSPDGRSLVYSTPVPPKEDATGFMREVYLLDFDQPQHAESIAKDFVVGYFWSPDSQRVAFFAPVFGPQTKSKESAPLPVEVQLGLFVVDIRSKEVKRLAVFTPTDAFLEILPFYDQYQRSITIWSPDSRHLVFTAGEADGTPGIFVVPSDGSSLQQRIARGEFAIWSWR